MGDLFSDAIDWGTGQFNSGPGAAMDAQLHDSLGTPAGTVHLPIEPLKALVALHRPAKALFLISALLLREVAELALRFLRAGLGLPIGLRRIKVFEEVS